MYKFISNTANTGLVGHYTLVEATTDPNTCTIPPPVGRLALSFDVVDENGGITRFSATDFWQELIVLAMSHGPLLQRCIGSVISIAQPPMVQQLLHEVGTLTTVVHDGLRQQENQTKQIEELRQHVRMQEATNRILSAMVVSIQEQLEKEQPRSAVQEMPVQVDPSSKNVCRHYAKKRYCLYGSHCRFAHID